MRVVRVSLRGIRSVLAALTLVVALGALAVFGLARLGVINPLVVISGSMEPGISKGDLLIDTRVAVEDLEVGQVVSIAPDADHLPVSHRIVDIQRDGDHALLQLKGDANTSLDAPIYQASGEVWAPRWRVPMAGYVITKLIHPQVMIPLAVAIGALMVFVMVPPAPRGTRGVRRGALVGALHGPRKPKTTAA